jgi:regulator of cell morphogenesis and NO signaling
MTQGPPISPRWDEAPLTALVDHVLAHYHVPLRADLARLVPLAEEVERRHAAEPGCPVGLARHLAAVQEAVEDHLGKEEHILFPLVAAGHGAHAAMPIRVMQEEHVEHEASLRRTRGLTGDLVPPAHADEDWRRLYRELAALETQLHEHIALENDVLFPRALRCS